MVRVGCIEDAKAKELLRQDVTGGDGGSSDGGDEATATATQPAPSSPSAPSSTLAPTSDIPKEVDGPPTVPVETQTTVRTTLITKTAARPKPSTSDPPAQVPSPSPEPTSSAEPTSSPEPSPSPDPTPSPEPTSNVPEEGSTTFSDIIKSPSSIPLALIPIDDDEEATSAAAVPTPTSLFNDILDGDDGDKDGGIIPDSNSDDSDSSSENETQQPAQPSEAPDYRTTIIFEGTPTVSLYFTITETTTETERVTATLIIPG